LCLRVHVPYNALIFHRICKFFPNYSSIPFTAARAIENQCYYILAAAQCGTNNEDRESYGHFLAIDDPWREVLKDIGGSNGSGGTSSDNVITSPSVVICDSDKLKSIRDRIPITRRRKHRAVCKCSW